MTLSRKLRYGMVGGGPGAFIGEVHRRAVRLDGQADLVAGSFSSDPDKSARHGASLHVAPDRSAYASFEEMAAREAARDDGIDFVSIVTPNHLHFPVAKAFIEHGIHVVSDKPMTTTVEEAEALCRLVDEHDVVFAVTYNYTGYPMVKQARAMVQDGALGAIRKIDVEYSQDWLATPLEREGDKQASWRTDPDKAGAGALGDIGSHAENIVRYVTGLGPQRLIADVGTVVEGRALDDDASMLVAYDEGARGLFTCSQIATGEENYLRLRVYGADASIDWCQEHPNHLRVRTLDGAEQVYTRASGYLSEASLRASRLPAGHPEGFFGAFANVYACFIRTLAARLAGDEPDPMDLDFPTVQDGAAGVHFIHTALESGRRQAWVDAAYTAPD